MVPPVFLKEGREKSQLSGSPGPGEASRHASDPDADANIRDGGGDAPSLEGTRVCDLE